jgi:hypothetical protein
VSLTCLALVPPSPAAAHDIPSDVTVQAFVKPEGRRLHLLVRVPLQAMRDVSYPTRGAGYLDVEKADAALREAAMLWIGDAVEVYENERLLGEPQIAAVRVSLPSDGAFDDYDDARRHFMAPPLPADLDLYWNQGTLDVAFDYPITAETSRFSIHPGFARLGQRVVTALRFLPPGGSGRPFELVGDPGLVRLDPRWHQAALRFVELGFQHILDGTDHLLFLLCLVIPFRRVRSLVLLVTSFTVAHSVTLIASAFDLAPRALWFPPLVETAIALSIVYMALENVLTPRLRRRALITFGFGLVHGFGFSFALRETLQFAGSYLLTSLLSFNVGVELGQLLVLLVLVPVLNLLFRAVPSRPGTIVLSALVAHTGWHWMLERWERLRQFRWEPPVWNAALLATALRWLMLAVLAGGLVWLVVGVLLAPGRRGDEATPAEE